MTSQPLAQITALCFSSGKYLLIGNAGFLEITCIKTGRQLGVLRVFKHNRIHRIKPISNYRYIVWGSKRMAVLEINWDTFSITLLKEKLFRDWIQGVSWLKNDGNEHYAILFSQNFVERWDLCNNNMLDCINCEERCMIYAGNLMGDSWDNLTIVSGTIFSHVLIWDTIHKTSLTTDRSQAGDAVVSKRIEGHEGVIFGIEFNNEGNLVCSVSDDRTIRIYDLRGTTETFSTVLEGHFGRVWAAKFVDTYIVSISEDASCRIWDLETKTCLSVLKGHGPKHVWSLAYCALNSIIVCYHH
jgi:WD40 repeat protein